MMKVFEDPQGMEQWDKYIECFIRYLQDHVNHLQGPLLTESELESASETDGILHYLNRIRLAYDQPFADGGQEH